MGRVGLGLSDVESGWVRSLKSFPLPNYERPCVCKQQTQTLCGLTKNAGHKFDRHEIEGPSVQAISCLDIWSVYFMSVIFSAPGGAIWWPAGGLDCNLGLHNTTRSAWNQLIDSRDCVR